MRRARPQLHVMNEYMAVESGDGDRLATFPTITTRSG